MIAGAGVRVDAEPFADHALPFFGHFRHQRLYAALFVEGAFALRDDHLWAALFGGECFDEGVAHFGDVVSARDRAHPFHAYAAHGVRDREFRLSNRIARGGRQNILAAGCGCVAVVDDDEQAIALIEDRVADAAGEPVVPETAVAHEADGALVGFFGVERSGACPAESVTHCGGADIERRQD